MEEIDPLANIGFISLKGYDSRWFGDFRIDPNILLPVEFPADRDAWSAEDISWEAIISAMLKLMAYDPDNEHIHYYRQFALAVKPGIGEELMEAGVLKAHNNDFDIAIEIFKALEGLLPDNAQAMLNLALVYEDRARQYQQLGNRELYEEYYELSFKAYKRAIAADPTLPDSHFNFAHFYLEQKSFAKAKEHFDQFLKIAKDPKKIREAQAINKEIESWEGMDQLFKGAFDSIKMGREEEGILKIKQFLDHHPGVWNAWFLLGWAYRRLKLYREGKEAFLRALSLNDNHPDTLNELSICLMELGELDESYRNLSRALQLDPDNTKVISNLGILALKRGNNQEAASFFKSVLVKDAADPLARKYLELIK